jgi:tetratricopeptide (TPR) repeat protein
MNIKAKKRRRVFVLVAAIMVGGASVGGLYQYRSFRYHRHLTEARAEGMAAAAAGDNVKAVNKLTEYLGKYNDDTEALSAFAKVRLKVEDEDSAYVRQAMGVLRRLIELEPNRAEERYTLMDLYLRSGFMTETIDTAQVLLDRDKMDVKALRAQALALEQLRKYAEAKKRADEWTAAAPEDLEGQFSVLRLMNRLQVPNGEIRQRGEDLAKAHPGDVRFQMVRAAALALTGDGKGASEALAALAKQPPSDAALALHLVGQLDSMGMYGESLAVLQQAEKQGNASVHRLLVRRMWEAGRLDEVVRLTETLPVEGNQVDLRAIRALALAQSGKKDDAEAIWKDLSAETGDVTKAWAMTVGMGTGHASKATDLQKAYTEAIKRRRSDGYLYYFLGQTYAQLDEAEQAVRAWEVASELCNTWSMPLLRLSELRLGQRRFDAAKEAAMGALRRSPNDVATTMNFARVVTESIQAGEGGDAQQILKYVDQVQQQAPGEEQTLMMKALLLAGSGQKDKAAATVRGALALPKPPSEQMLLKLAVISRAHGLGLEQSCLDLSEKAHGVSPDLALARASELVEKGKGADAVESLKSARAKSGSPDALAWKLATARLLDLAGDGGAKPAWAELAEHNPDALAIQRAALEARSVRADRELSDKIIDRMHGISGDDGIVWKVARAKWILAGRPDEKDLVKASQLLNEAIRVDGDGVETRVLLAQVLERLGNTAGASEQMGVAAQKDGGSAPVVLQYARLLQARGNAGQARQQLDKLLEQGKLSPEQKTAAAILLLQQGASDRALPVLKSIETPSDEVQMLLAAAYRLQGQPEKAGDIYRQLVAAKPGVGTIRAMADFLDSQGRRAEAESTLSMLDKLDLKPGTKEALLAEYLSAHGRGQEAVQKLREATTKAPDMAAAWRGLVLQLVALGKGDEAVTAAADGLRSVKQDEVLSGAVQHGELLKAAAADPLLVGVACGLATNPKNAAAAEALRAVLEAKRTKGDPKALATKLRALADQDPRSLPLQLLAMNVCIAAGQLDDAVALGTRASAAFPNEAEPIAFTIEALVRDTRPGQADRWSRIADLAQALRERSKGDPLAADMAAASAQLNLGHADQAIATLRPHLQRIQAEPKKYPVAIMTYAQAQLRAGRADDAAQLLWPLAQQAKEWRQVWMQLAMANPDGPKAAAWLQKVETVVPADDAQERTALSEAWAFLGHRLGKPEYRAHGTEILDAVLRGQGPGAEAMVARGMHYEQDNDAVNAERMYRAAIAKQPDHWVALNNLAMVLVRKGEKLDEAVQLASAAVKAQPGDPNPYDTLAAAQQKAKAYDAAIASMRQAVKLQPANLDWRVHLAEIQLESGRRADAARTLTEIDALPDAGPVPPSVAPRLESLRAAVTKQASAQGS